MKRTKADEALSRALPFQADILPNHLDNIELTLQLFSEIHLLCECRGSDFRLAQNDCGARTLACRVATHRGAWGLPRLHLSLAV